MGSFGENLRREREARGIALADISKATKISVRLLQAIEGEEFDRLPGGVFNVNFVRQYARHVGLDEERVVSEFRALTADPAEIPVLQRTGTGSPERAVAPAESPDWDRPRGSRGRTWTTLALVVVAVAAAGYLWLRERPAAPVATAPAPAPVQQPSAPAPAEPPPVQNAAPPPQVRPEPKAPPYEPDPNAPLRVELRATEQVWIAAWADGTPVFATTLEAQQTRRVGAQSRVRLRVGNAGAVTVVLNGQEQPPLGPLGQVRNVILTAAGMQVPEPPSEKKSEEAGPGAAPPDEKKTPAPPLD